MVRGNVDYQKGIIYTIKSGDSIYVGSTTNFRARRSQHKNAIKNKPTKIYQTIRDNDGEWEMKPYQLFPCNSKVELEIQEEKVRQKLTADLNCKSCSGLDKEHRKEYSKEYYQQNKEQYKEYYQQNKEQVKQNDKERYERNKEQFKKHDKEYYQQNKERISKRKKEYYQRNKEKLKQYQTDYTQKKLLT